jgi:hypothetical protein
MSAGRTPMGFLPRASQGQPPAGGGEHWYVMTSAENMLAVLKGEKRVVFDPPLPADVELRHIANQDEMVMMRFRSPSRSFPGEWEMGNFDWGWVSHQRVEFEKPPSYALARLT